MKAFIDINPLLHMYFMLFYSYFASAVSFPLYFLSCELQGRFYLYGIHKTGDVVLGRLFEINFITVFPDLSFTSEPQQPTCYG